MGGQSRPDVVRRESFNQEAFVARCGTGQERDAASGEVQAIGGVNEKIEGFFQSCKRRGLTGTQGVIIPNRNVKHLALTREVVEAVEAGKFAVYGVDYVDQALELLTGIPAGERTPEGGFPPDSLYGRASTRLGEMAQVVAEWGEGEEEKVKG